MPSTTYDSGIFEVHSKESDCINIVIADDFPVLIGGIRQCLAPCDDIVVVAECTRLSDLLAQVSLKKPEIILLGCETETRQSRSAIFIVLSSVIGTSKL